MADENPGICTDLLAFILRLMKIPDFAQIS